MFDLLLIFITSVIFGTLVVVELKRLRTSKKYKHISGIKEYPVIGSDLMFTFSRFRDISLISNILQTAPVSKALIFYEAAFLVSDPIVLQEVVSGNNFSERPYFFDFFRIPHGIISAKYTQWKPIRKVANPSFSNKTSTSLIPIFQKHALRLCEQLATRLDQETFDVYDLILRINVSLTLEANFDTEFKDINLITHLFERYSENLVHRMFCPLLHVELFYKFSKLAKDDKIILDAAYQNLEIEMQKYKAEIGVEKIIASEKRTFLYELTRHLDHYSDEKLKMDIFIENVVMILATALETTVITISYVLLMLAMHPKVDQQLEQELVENYHEGDEISQELFKRLPFLDRVIKETLRLFPAVPISARQNLESVTLSKIGHVDKGTIFILNFFNLHRWKHIWGEDAEQFNPDRFLPENSIDRHPFAFQPFSTGPRNCLGYQYAMINMKTALVLILSRYKFTTELKMEELAFKYSITLKLVTQHLVRVHERRKRGGN